MLRLARQQRTRRGGEGRTALSRAPLRRRGALPRAVAGAAAGGRRGRHLAGAAAGGRLGRKGRYASQLCREVRTIKARGSHTATAATVKPCMPASFGKRGGACV